MLRIPGPTALPSPDRQKVIDEFLTATKEKGDPAAGKAVFKAQCAKCHKHQGEGENIGPDLTGINARLGAAGLPPVLAALPFPTLQPIYRTRPLTSREQRDLAAFFSAAAGRTPLDSAPRIIGLAVAGFLLLFVVAGVARRSRLKSVRRALVEEMRRKGGAGE